MPDTLRPLPAGFAATRDALHRLAVYVVSPAREATDGKIRLRPTPGGFGFGPVGEPPLGVYVAGTHLVVERGEDSRAKAIGSLASAAELAGIAPALSKQEGFDVPPHGDVTEPLSLDEASAEALADWFDVALEALARLHEAIGADDEIVLWPEHFDVAFSHGDEGTRLTFGASPGDANHPEPYAYVLPPAAPAADPYWNATGFTGAELPYADVAGRPGAADLVVAFFEEGRRRVQGGPR